MQIDWGAFTPWMALSGGLVIGLSAAAFVLLNGRVAGISGILGGLLPLAGGDIAWFWVGPYSASAGAWSACVRVPPWWPWAC